MEIPDGIYLQWEDPDCELGVTWCVDKINDDDIEYALKADLAAARAWAAMWKAGYRKLWDEYRPWFDCYQNANMIRREAEHNLAAARAESEGYRAALEAARNALGNANFNTQGSYQLAADAMTRIAEALK